MTTNEKTEAALSDIEARQRQIAADKAAADKEQDVIDRQIAQLREQAAANAKAQRELDEQRERLEREAIDRQRELRPDHVDRDVAASVATDLLDAFEAVHVTEAEMVGPDRRAERLWDAIDDARCRLLTDDIAEDARPVVLAIEGVIEACDFFESFRRPEFGAARAADGEPPRDIRAWAFPEQSGIVRKSLDELRRELSGEAAPPPIEGVGELIGQNVTFRHRRARPTDRPGAGAHRFLPRGCQPIPSCSDGRAERHRCLGAAFKQPGASTHEKPHVAGFCRPPWSFATWPHDGAASARRG
ncbi:hypothetical protein Mal33_08820 [Rosistilla oblonga]|uniref:Uncharacterized protein n=1 Tax=Rosistilla oblonga TaxID=2527990 RepID=A0A518IP96_9BACT|nr:hypothetical protein Mal33_08820 [Rosistilla oblonga]